MRTVQLVAKWTFIVSVLVMVGWAVCSAFNVADVKKTTIYMGKAILRAEVADDVASREKGLGGRSSIRRDEAMLFVFEDDDSPSIWMKDMSMSIDIVWLNANRRVVHIERNVRPDAEPHKVYKSPKPAKYVIEMRAGIAKKFNIKTGMIVKFDLDE